MNSIKRLGVITTVALTMDALIMAPALLVPQADPKLGRAEAHTLPAYMNNTSTPLNAYPAFRAPFFIIGEGAAR